MMTTINISLPTNMYDQLKRFVSQRGYSSVSELVRDTLRDTIYSTKTINGFTPEFEDEILKSEAEPRKNDIVLKTEKDVHNYFRKLIKPKKS